MLEVAGRPHLRVGLQCDSPSCDMFVRLCDVYPDGASAIVCDGVMRFGGFSSELEKPDSPGSALLVGPSLGTDGIWAMESHMAVQCG